MRRALGRLVLPLFLVLSPGSLAATAAADPRLDATPTGWWHYYGATEATITNLINTQNARLVDIEVATTGSPYTFDATFVSNSGSNYVSGWWWYYGVTLTDINNLLAANQARLVDLRRYSTGSGDRFACVMVNNTGGEARAWWWYVGVTAAQLTGFISSNNARLVSVTSFVSGGTTYFDAVMLSNTGSDQLGWWWYYGVTGGQVSSFLNANNARLYDWHVYTDAGVRKFDVIMVQNTGPALHWWWWYDSDVANIVKIADQNGARVFDIESYVPSGTRLYGALMLNNSNALTTRIGDILQYGANGATGCYLKAVGGGVLASLQPSFVFEPASTIKGLIALHFMRGVQGGTEVMGNTHSQFTAYTGSCPLDMTPVTETFRLSLYRMLKYSDNARTQFFRRRYGNEAINGTATGVVGMTSSALHHRLGCGDSAVANPNQLTLADAGLMYEKIFNATALNAQWRDTLRTYLVNESDNFPFQTNLFAIVDQEAAATGTSSIAADYKSQIRFGFKAGSYGIYCSPCEYYYSIAGWLELPACGARGPQFVFGTFIHGSADDASASNRLWSSSAELFREQIRTGLVACAVDAPPSPVATRITFDEPRPNPAQYSSLLSYRLPYASSVRLAIVDVTGRAVAELVRRVEGPGDHRVTWEARDGGGRRVPAGVYFATLHAGGQALVRKVIVER